MKTSYLFVLFLILLSVSIVSLNYAGAGVYGSVNITILASPPSVASIMITPEPAYADSSLHCEAELWGNNLVDATVNYKWYVNGELRTEEKQIANLKVGDKIECEVWAYDSLGRGERKSNNTLIIPKTSHIIGYVTNGMESISDGKIALLAPLSLISIMLFVRAIRVKN